MKIDTILHRKDPPLSKLKSYDSVVIIDVLRFTSFAVTALSAGAIRIYPAVSIAQAKSITKNVTDSILCGERNSMPIKNFDFTNSPSEILNYKNILKNKKIIMTTTNGTKTVLSFSDSKELILLSMLNLQTVSNYIISKKKLHSLLIVCSGDNCNFSLEDFFAAGALIYSISKYIKPKLVSDKSIAALQFYESYKNKSGYIFKNSIHGKDLIAKGYVDDIILCSKLNKFYNIPVLKKSNNARLPDCGLNFFTNM